MYSKCVAKNVIFLLLIKAKHECSVSTAHLRQLMALKFQKKLQSFCKSLECWMRRLIYQNNQRIFRFSRRSVAAVATKNHLHCGAFYSEFSIIFSAHPFDGVKCTMRTSPHFDMIKIMYIHIICLRRQENWKNVFARF